MPQLTETGKEVIIYNTINYLKKELSYKMGNQVSGRLQRRKNSENATASGGYLTGEISRLILYMAIK
jgi:hypothetical protein